MAESAISLVWSCSVTKIKRENIFYKHIWIQSSKIQFLSYFCLLSQAVLYSGLSQDHITNASLWLSLAEHCPFYLLFWWSGFIFHVMVLSQVTLNCWLPVPSETSLPAQLPSHQLCLLSTVSWMDFLLLFVVHLWWPSPFLRSNL